MKQLITAALSLALALAPLAGAQQANDPDFATGNGAGDRIVPDQPFASRSTVIAPNGAAATAHPLATEVAIDVLKQGGSAIDAAIAANAMLGLIEPTGNGLGGDIFVLVWDPKTEKLYGYNGSGRSPMGATLEDVQAVADEFRDGEGIPPYGSWSVSVPGAADGWFALHGKFGKLSMADVLAQPIHYAENGAPVTEVIAYYWERSRSRFEQVHEDGMLEEIENARETFFPGGRAPVEGELFRNPDLANTLRILASEGRDGFYKGEIARSIDAYMKRIGGPLGYEDMAAHEGEWVEPVCVDYREAKVCGLPPNTQGVATLQMLQLLDNFPMAEYGYGSADSIMAQVEAKRLAFADRARLYADPDYSGLNPLAFVDPMYAKHRLGFIDLEQAMADPYAGDLPDFNGTALGDYPSDPEGVEPPMTISVETSIDPVTPESIIAADDKLEDGDTTYLSVADKDGMMVSLIQSNYRGMGSGLVPDGTGFMLQDRGELFSLDPDHPNVFEPGKRPFHTIIPGFAFKRDLPGCQVRSVPFEQACPHEPWLAFGVMGGGMQPQGQTQIILNLIDHGMGLQEAGDAARWRHDGGGEPTDRAECLAAGETPEDCPSKAGVIRVESGISAETRAELEARGFEVRDGRAGFGGYQAVMRDFEHGTWHAATEYRKDGAAGGY